MKNWRDNALLAWYVFCLGKACQLIFLTAAILMDVAILKLAELEIWWASL